MVTTAHASSTTCTDVERAATRKLDTPLQPGPKAWFTRHASRTSRAARNDAASLDSRRNATRDVTTNDATRDVTTNDATHDVTNHAMYDAFDAT